MIYPLRNVYFTINTKPIEKIIKAIIAHRSEKTPLPTHNFKLLLDQAELKNIPEDKKKFIFGLQPHYIGTKYPEDIAKLYKQYTITFVQNLFKETREVFQWLENYLK
jgi:HEPN domain-containing protein